MSGLNISLVVRSVPAVIVALGGLIAPGFVTAAAVTTTPSSFNYTTTGSIRNRPATVAGPAQLSFSGVDNGSYVTGSNQTIQLGQFVVNPAKTLIGGDAVTTYNGTPFVIQIRASQFDKTKDIPLLAKILPTFGRSLHLKNQTLNSLLIKGHLDGTVSGSGASNVTATVDSTRLGTIDKLPKNTAVNYSFPVRYGQLKLPTSWKMNTTGNALASVAAVPNPILTPLTSPVTTNTVGSTATPVAASAAAQILATPAAEILAATTPLGEPTPTPEPATVFTFVVALGGFAWSRRNRAGNVPPIS